ncbi:MerR family transcriptional regulator [Brevibacillus migulae]|uniref:MerR family transcriptional regulator n=1 Tax=Brevibacillus migulae TaxID=1644114 RepID=UPI00106E2E20|nr:hypothetical protein [Brevibacillus migulae]
MSDDILEQKKAYWPREVADLLDISESTLRKYCLILEEKGYTFLRGENNRRAYLDRDVIALRKFMELSQNKSVTLEEAAIAVLSMISDHTVTSITHADTQQLSPSHRLTHRFDEWGIKLDQLIRYNEQRDREYQELLTQNERLQHELELVRSEVASTHDKLDSITQQVETVITESRAERHRRKSWWAFWK